jgi:hypothetical protein
MIGQTGGRVETLSPSPLLISSQTAKNISNESANCIELSQDDFSDQSTNESQPDRDKRNLIPPNPPRRSTRSSKGKLHSTYKDYELNEVNMLKKSTWIVEVHNTIQDNVDNEGTLDFIGVAAPRSGSRLKAYQIVIPKDLKQAMEMPQSQEWLEACKTRLSKIKEKNGYTLEDVDPKQDSEILPGKWVFDLKCDNEGWILEYRARWVICGNFEWLDGN